MNWISFLIGLLVGFIFYVFYAKLEIRKSNSECDFCKDLIYELNATIYQYVSKEWIFFDEDITIYHCPCCGKQLIKKWSRKKLAEIADEIKALKNRPEELKDEEEEYYDA